MKMQPILLFDYMKGFYFKIINENEDYKTRLSKSAENEYIKEILQISKENETYFATTRKNLESV